MKQDHKWLDTAIVILQKERLERGESIALDEKPTIYCDSESFAAPIKKILKS